jgi:murein DD-endopeptidase MepM/ murein hydrolase activator NlpD
LLILVAVGYGTLTNSPFKSSNKAFAAPVNGLSMPSGSTGTLAVSGEAALRAPNINKTIREQSVATEPQRSGQIQAQAAEPTPTATAQPIAEQEDAVVREAAVAPTPVLQPYFVYQAQEGDSPYGIAERFGVDAEYIIANNAELAATGLLSLGQAIIVPTQNGILHEIRYGETLSDIAARYDVEPEAITGFAANGIADPDALLETQVVFVPDAQILPAAPFEAPVDDAASGEATPEPDTDESLDTGPESSAGLIWPMGGPVSSPYSSGHPLGIDIDGYNSGGAGVVAATSGTVVFAGGNACCSYGLYVVIMSDSGIETLYAHLSSISVSQGEIVSQGEVIGVVGNTGYSTGTHLHFEVIDNGVRQNPMNYLP